MPKCGSQIILCEVPIRYDTYSGCSHGCNYCFAYRKGNIEKIGIGESYNELKKFIEGDRTGGDVNWCDWQIPIHWGGMSDPFQPLEREKGLSLKVLKLFRETQYPFIVSTKNKLIAEGEYFDEITKCNCVVQFSAISPKYDKIETGASTFAERIEAARKIAAEGIRVNIRMQPYTTQVLGDVLDEIPMLAEIGVHGIILEGIKYFKKQPGFIQIGGDYCYPIERLKRDFEKIRDKAHEHGLKFYSGENRLRQMGDDTCCCGVEGMGWKTNKANLLNALIGNKIEYTEAMKKPGTAIPYRNGLMQDTISGHVIQNMSYEEVTNITLKDKKLIKQIIGEQL